MLIVGYTVNIVCLFNVSYLDASCMEDLTAFGLNLW